MLKAKLEDLYEEEIRKWWERADIVDYAWTEDNEPFQDEPLLEDRALEFDAFRRMPVAAVFR